ncbi:uncharacterized protein AB675_3405 [Cyphellophora attinorum]|uniref:Uncharacterized protein n=1 Tax=Cyphellophora attinorum TaxID=1664694 RepID=A0A0N1NY73_9EURO|nr:uncharacterized protein AB675_3405 [Phialophora attinorum]KPI39615.1 hypothetical protein AB675_3405 [Phialophora attinorum]
MESYNHYQNSSFKTSPAQRDASSSNAAIYVEARRQRDEQSQIKQLAKRREGLPAEDPGMTALPGENGTGASLGDGTSFSNDISDRSTSDEVAPRPRRSDTPAYKVDSRGNVYRQNHNGVGKWWAKMKGLLTGQSRGGRDQVIVR